MMKSTTKLQFSVLAFSSVIAIAFFAVFVPAPSIIWTSDSDWSGGTHSNTISINGDLQLNRYYSDYNNWTYRKAIIINGSTSLQNDYQVMINLTNRTASSDNFDFARANSQGNDTRFTWLNTSSGLEQNLSFWIENWTSSGSLGNATIWVKVPNVTASSVANTTLYMYYGNPIAASASSESVTFYISNRKFDFSPLGRNWTCAANGSGACNAAYSGDYKSSPKSGYMYETYRNCGRAHLQQNITLPDISPLYLHYWRKEYHNKWGGPTGIKINATNTSWNSGTILHTWGSNSSEYTSSWEEFWDDISAFSGQTVLLEIFYHDDTDNDALWCNQGDHGAWLAVDDLSITTMKSNPSPEPSVLSVGTEQTTASRGTYLSNTITIPSIIFITPSWNGTQPNANVNFTVEISANNGANWITASNNTAYTSGDGSGTQLRYRINFSTNDTNRTATVSGITMNYTFNSPQWSANSTKLSSPQTYNPSNNYGFQINWTDNVVVFNATFQLGRPNGQITNYTNLSGSAPAVANISSTYHINFTQDQFGPAGTYNITWHANNTNNNQNSTDTVLYTIIPAATNIIFWINSVAANASISQGNNINLTATMNITNTVYIYANLTGWVLLSNSTGTLTNTTSSGGVSTGNFFNITAYFAGNENYSASSQHFHINITADITYPTILLFNGTSQPFLNASVIKKYGSTFAVNASVSDTGVGVSGQNCTAYVNGTSAGSGTESGGFCNMTVTMPAGGNGNVTLNITINDNNGNVGYNDSFVVTMDNTAPNLTINAPASGQYLKGTIWVNGTVYDNIAIGTTNITVNNISFSISPYGNFDGTNNSVFNISNVSALADGYYLLNVGYTDKAGNDGNATIAFFVDNTPPSAAVGLTNSTAGTKYAPISNQTIQVVVSDGLKTNDAITLNYKLGTASWATTTMTGTPGTTTVYTGTINTIEISYSIGMFVQYYITGTDNATNSITAVVGGSTPSPLNSFVVNPANDSTAPTISFAAPTNSTNVTTTTPTITFSVEEDIADNIIDISVSGMGGFSKTGNYTGGNAWKGTYSFKPSALTNGQNYNITVTATNKAGLSATSSITIGVDTTKDITASLIASDTSGVADNTYANGWSYTFNITLGTGVNATKVKLNNFTLTTDSTKTIGVPGNVIMNYTNASGYAKSYNVLESYNETSGNIDPLFDIDSNVAGVQGNVTIYVKIPSGTVAGDYSTAYTFGSYTI